MIREMFSTRVYFLFFSGAPGFLLLFYQKVRSWGGKNQPFFQQISKVDNLFFVIYMSMARTSFFPDHFVWGSIMFNLIHLYYEGASQNLM